ncbi:MAG: LamG-like jellyroll fold domain-containing protein, partial [Methylococcaceae bacterium]
TLGGNPQCVDGVKGKAFSFDGDANYVRLNTNSSSLFSNDFSIGVWVKFHNFQNAYPMIVEAENYNVAFHGLGSAYSSDLQKRVGFYQQNQDGYPISRIGQMESSSKLEENKWYFVTVVKADLQFKMYLNSDVSISTTATKNILMDGKFITVGASILHPSSSGLNGEIDDLRIYNRALTEAEVMELYNGGGVVAEKPVLVAEVCSPTQTAIFQTGENSGTLSSSAASCVTTGNSTLADLVDLEKSSIDYANGKIKVVLKNAPTLGNLSYFGIIAKINDKEFENKSYQYVAEESTRTSSSSSWTRGQDIPKEMSFSFNSLQNRNGLITINLYRTVGKGGEITFYEGTLYGVNDNVRLAKQSILASRKLSETKPHSGIECKTVQGISSECNNFFATDEIAAEDSKNATFQDTLTHRIVDFDKVVNQKTINTTWANSPYGKKPLNDNGRIPLLLIHGWQGDKDLRNPAKLGLWNYSELHYWQHFLDYYLTSTALQKKYHLYLYHYPSYKHVTYNASVLNDLFQDVGKNSSTTDLGRAMTSSSSTDPKNNLTIVAHSMGGMVARSLIEEYQGLGNTKVYGSSYASAMVKLNQLITLDTPHHGSTGSDPDPDGVKGAISGALGSTAKDLTSQGATDLNWDNYDNRLSNDKITTNNENYRWAKANTKMFDAVYCAGCKTLNPWLLNMNKQFENNYITLAKDKYVIYAAWMSSFREDGDDAGNATAINPIENNIDYNIAENIGIPNLPNGVAEPVTSALLSKFDVKTQKTLPFNPECKEEFPTWIVPKQISYFQDWLIDKESLLPEISTAREDVLCIKSARLSAIQLRSILIPTTTSEYAHPYGLPYRIFWDYDHEKMVNGAYARSLNIFKDYVGIWDQFVLSQKFDPKVANETSAFASNSLRNNYIYAASKFRDKKSFGISNNQVYSPLRAEPLYLILEGDLLKK